jgi:putative oxygen-independent coproporphyrinogen III oxidase
MPEVNTTRLIAPPLAVYVHLPWCIAKCPYCDFNSHVAPQTLPQEQYIDALLADLDVDLPLVADRPVQCVFFGGGTPSLFAPQAIGRFLTELRRRVPMATDVEVTLEANPGALEHGRFAGYRDAGVTRISVGVQSFNNRHLKALGRIHQSDHVFRAVSELKQAGFDNFNLDLMYGLPQQSTAEAVDDLAQAIALHPTHISHYQLTLEPGTVFYHRPPPVPDDDLLWDMQEACQAQLAAAGHQQYEVSAYAQPNRQCRHNVNYWQFGDYLGLGAGAHGKLTDVEHQQIWRTVRQKQPREYLAATAAARLTERRVVLYDELPFEFALNALRLQAGLTVELFESRTGLSVAAIEPTLKLAQQRQLLIEVTPGEWRPTELGQRFLNDLLVLFLRPPNTQRSVDAAKSAQEKPDYSR